MSIVQFLKILWAYRNLTAATLGLTLFGALVAILIVPPSYEASSRVMLNTLKPDPVTGQVLPTVASRSYEANEVELIQDYVVVAKAVDQLGWASDPNWLRQYRDAGVQNVDIRRWISQKIIDHTKVKPVNGTNILEISYSAQSPQQAKAMADALRNNYVDTSLDMRRKEAARAADWFDTQAQQAQALLDKADTEKTAFEKANGIVMQADNTDVDTARLRALSSAGAVGAPVIAPPPTQTSAAAVQLAALDAAIAQASQNLGPNHPQMLEMKSRRTTLAQLAAQDLAAQRAAQAAATGAAGANAGALERAVEQQTARVIAKRDKIQRLSQLQAEVNLRREQYNHAIGRAAELRQEAVVADNGVTILSDAVEPQKPTFPNKPLIFGGAGVLGVALGVLLSLLIELFNRRVRGVEDLESSLDVPVLAVISTPAGRVSSSKKRPRLSLPGIPGRRTAQA